jgi:hypothetical protein
MSNKINLKVGEISLTESDYDKVQGLMKNWGMSIEELCTYAVVSIANVHHSERAQALLECGK